MSPKRRADQTLGLEVKCGKKAEGTDSDEKAQSAGRGPGGDPRGAEQAYGKDVGLNRQDENLY